MGTYNTKHGVITIEGDTQMENRLRDSGEYMYDDIKVCLPYVHGVVVDIGAHVGLWTIPLSKHAKRVIAIEPNRYTYTQLLKNIQDNDAQNVTTHNVLLGDSKQKYAQLDTHATGTNHYHIGGAIPASGLDAYIHEKISFIKIDVEGMEPDVLAGAQHTLSESRPHLFIEVNPKMLRKYGKTPSDISHNLHGYVYYRFDSKYGWCKIPYLMNSFYNFLAVPREAPQPNAVGFCKYVFLKLFKKL